jgi:hypothetical protein
MNQQSNENEDDKIIYSSSDDLSFLKVYLSTVFRTRTRTHTKPNYELNWTKSNPK